MSAAPARSTGAERSDRSGISYPHRTAPSTSRRRYDGEGLEFARNRARVAGVRVLFIDAHDPQPFIEALAEALGGRQFVRPFVCRLARELGLVVR